ncbi:zeta toxin family protein [Actinomycetes bacterium KLBMP 9797]
MAIQPPDNELTRIVLWIASWAWPGFPDQPDLEDRVDDLAQRWYDAAALDEQQISVINSQVGTVGSAWRDTRGVLYGNHLGRQASAFRELAAQKRQVGDLATQYATRIREYKNSLRSELIHQGIVFAGLALLNPAAAATQGVFIIGRVLNLASQLMRFYGNAMRFSGVQAGAIRPFPTFLNAAKVQGLDALAEGMQEINTAAIEKGGYHANASAVAFWSGVAGSFLGTPANAALRPLARPLGEHAGKVVTGAASNAITSPTSSLIGDAVVNNNWDKLAERETWEQAYRPENVVQAGLVGGTAPPTIDAGIRLGEKLATPFNPPPAGDSQSSTAADTSSGTASQNPPSNPDPPNNGSAASPVAPPTAAGPDVASPPAPTGEAGESSTTSAATATDSTAPVSRPPLIGNGDTASSAAAGSNAPITGLGDGSATGADPTGRPSSGAATQQQTQQPQENPYQHTEASTDQPPGIADQAPGATEQTPGSPPGQDAHAPETTSPSEIRGTSPDVSSDSASDSAYVSNAGGAETTTPAHQAEAAPEAAPNGSSGQPVGGVVGGVVGGMLPGHASIGPARRELDATADSEAAKKTGDPADDAAEAGEPSNDAPAAQPHESAEVEGAEVAAEPDRPASNLDAVPSGPVATGALAAAAPAAATRVAPMDQPAPRAAPTHTRLSGAPAPAPGPAGSRPGGILDALNPGPEPDGTAPNARPHRRVAQQPTPADPPAAPAPTAAWPASQLASRLTVVRNADSGWTVLLHPRDSPPDQGRLDAVRKTRAPHGEVVIVGHGQRGQVVVDGGLVEPRHLVAALSTLGVPVNRGFLLAICESLTADPSSFAPALQRATDGPVLAYRGPVWLNRWTGALLGAPAVVLTDGRVVPRPHAGPRQPSGFERVLAATAATEPAGPEYDVDTPAQHLDQWERLGSPLPPHGPPPEEVSRAGNDWLRALAGLLGALGVSPDSLAPPHRRHTGDEEWMRLAAALREPPLPRGNVDAALLEFTASFLAEEQEAAVGDPARVAAVYAFVRQHHDGAGLPLEPAAPPVGGVVPLRLAPHARQELTVALLDHLGLLPSGFTGDPDAAKRLSQEDMARWQAAYDATHHEPPVGFTGVDGWGEFGQVEGIGQVLVADGNPAALAEAVVRGRPAGLPGRGPLSEAEQDGFDAELRAVVGRRFEELGHRDFGRVLLSTRGLRVFVAGYDVNVRLDIEVGQLTWRHPAEMLAWLDAQARLSPGVVPGQQPGAGQGVAQGAPVPHHETSKADANVIENTWGGSLPVAVSFPGIARVAGNIRAYRFTSGIHRSVVVTSGTRRVKNAGGRGFFEFTDAKWHVSIKAATEAGPVLEGRRPVDPSVIVSFPNEFTRPSDVPAERTGDLIVLPAATELDELQARRLAVAKVLLAPESIGGLAKLAEAMVAQVPDASEEVTQRVHEWLTEAAVFPRFNDFLGSGVLTPDLELPGTRWIAWQIRADVASLQRVGTRPGMRFRNESRLSQQTGAGRGTGGGYSVNPRGSVGPSVAQAGGQLRRGRKWAGDITTTVGGGEWRTVSQTGDAAVYRIGAKLSAKPFTNLDGLADATVDGALIVLVPAREAARFEASMRHLAGELPVTEVPDHDGTPPTTTYHPPLALAAGRGVGVGALDRLAGADLIVNRIVTGLIELSERSEPHAYADTRVVSQIRRELTAIFSGESMQVNHAELFRPDPNADPTADQPGTDERFRGGLRHTLRHEVDGGEQVAEIRVLPVRGGPLRVGELDEVSIQVVPLSYTEVTHTQTNASESWRGLGFSIGVPHVAGGALGLSGESGPGREGTSGAAVSQVDQLARGETYEGKAVTFDWNVDYVIDLRITFIPRLSNISRGDQLRRHSQHGRPPGREVTTVARERVAGGLMRVVVPQSLAATQAHDPAAIDRLGRTEELGPIGVAMADLAEIEPISSTDRLVDIHGGAELERILAKLLHAAGVSPSQAEIIARDRATSSQQMAHLMRDPNGAMTFEVAARHSHTRVSIWPTVRGLTTDGGQVDVSHYRRHEVTHGSEGWGATKQSSTKVVTVPWSQWSSNGGEDTLALPGRTGTSERGHQQTALDREQVTRGAQLLYEAQTHTLYRADLLYQITVETVRTGSRKPQLHERFLRVHDGLTFLRPDPPPPSDRPDRIPSELPADDIPALAETVRVEWGRGAEHTDGLNPAQRVALDLLMAVAPGVLAREWTQVPGRSQIYREATRTGLPQQVRTLLAQGSLQNNLNVMLGPGLVIPTSPGHAGKYQGHLLLRAHRLGPYEYLGTVKGATVGRRNTGTVNEGTRDERLGAAGHGSGIEYWQGHPPDNLAQQGPVLPDALGSEARPGGTSHHEITQTDGEGSVRATTRFEGVNVRGDAYRYQGPVEITIELIPPGWSRPDDPARAGRTRTVRMIEHVLAAEPSLLGGRSDPGQRDNPARFTVSTSDIIHHRVIVPAIAPGAARAMFDAVARALSGHDPTLSRPAVQALRRLFAPGGLPFDALRVALADATLSRNLAAAVSREGYRKPVRSERPGWPGQVVTFAGSIGIRVAFIDPAPQQWITARVVLETHHPDETSTVRSAERTTSHAARLPAGPSGTTGPTPPPPSPAPSGSPPAGPADGQEWSALAGVGASYGPAERHSARAGTKRSDGDFLERFGPFLEVTAGLAIEVTLEAGRVYDARTGPVDVHPVTLTFRADQAATMLIHPEAAMGLSDQLEASPGRSVLDSIPLVSTVDQPASERVATGGRYFPAGPAAVDGYHGANSLPRMLNTFTVAATYDAAADGMVVGGRRLGPGKFAQKLLELPEFTKVWNAARSSKGAVVALVAGGAGDPTPSADGRSFAERLAQELSDRIGRPIRVVATADDAVQTPIAPDDLSHDRAGQVVAGRVQVDAAGAPVLHSIRFGRWTVYDAADGATTARQLGPDLTRALRREQHYRREPIALRPGTFPPAGGYRWAPLNRAVPGNVAPPSAWTQQPPGPGAPTWDAAQLAGYVEALTTHTGATVVWVRSPAQAADPSLRLSVARLKVPAGHVGVLSHGSGGKAFVDGGWVDGALLAAEVNSRGLPLSQGDVLLVCEAMTGGATSFATEYRQARLVPVYAAPVPVWWSRATGAVIAAVGVDDSGQLRPLLPVRGHPAVRFRRVDRAGDATGPALRYMHDTDGRLTLQAWDLAGAPGATGWGDSRLPTPLPSGHELLTPTHTIDTPRRRELRARLLAGALDGARAPDSGPPVLHLVVGGGGSGKESLLEHLRTRGEIPVAGAVHIDSDRFKTQLPEYRRLVAAGDSRAAAVVHEESSALAKELRSAALARGLPMVHLATFGDPGKAVGLIRTAKEHGYEVRLYGVFADAELAVHRNLARAESTGRYVPIGTQLRAAVGFSRGFPAYADLVDRAVLFDGSTLPAARIAVREPGADLRITDPSRYAEFARQAELNPQARRPAELYQTPDPIMPLSTPLTRAEFVNKAMRNLYRTSRTAERGELDISSAVEKAAQLVPGITGDRAARLGVTNYRETLDWLYENRHIRLASPPELRAFVEGVAARVNAGIIRDGLLYREYDSAKHGVYTAAADLPPAADQFYDEFFARLERSGADAVETAAWVHYRMDLTDHLWADGSSRTAGAVAAWVLLRAGHDLPTHPAERAAQFAHAPRLPRATGPGVDAFQQREWLDHYRMLFAAPASTDIGAILRGREHP